MRPTSENRKRPLPESSASAEQPFEVRATETGRCLIARRNIATGTRLFGEETSPTRPSGAVSTLSERSCELAAERAAFVRYGYNTAPDQVTGALDPETVRHPTNFLNHSCDPNAGYDGSEYIVALRAIPAGEEIRMDYGTFSFSFDHEFSCRCGAVNCRGKVTANDWPDLVRAGLRLPAFMRERADRLS